MKKKMKLRLQHLIPFLFILSITIVAYTTTAFYPQSWDILKEIHLNIKQFNDDHPYLTPLFFIMFYILYALLMLPGIVFLALLSGFLFTQPFSTLYVITAATVGSSLLFLIARTAFRELLNSNSNSFLSRFEEGFRKNATNYMLFLRLMPLFPFKAVNLAGAFFDVPYRIFAWTTFVGMIPSVFIYTEAGKGLSSYLDDSSISIWNLFDPTLLIVFAGLAALALVPIFLKSRIKSPRI